MKRLLRGLADRFVPIDQEPAARLTPAAGWRKSTGCAPPSGRDWPIPGSPPIGAAKADRVVDVATMRQAYPGAEVLVIDDGLSPRTKRLRQSIQARLCRNAHPAFELIVDRRGE